jgi:hypothetical protein
LVFVPGTIEDCHGCNEQSLALPGCATHYLRRCSKCGNEELWHSSEPVFFGPGELDQGAAETPEQ